MALVDACIFSAASGGTSDFQVVAAVQGYMTPAEANAVDGDPYNYRAQSSDLSQWEIGAGLYDAGTTTLERVTVLFNSNGTGTLQSGPGSKIDFTDAPQVMLTALTTDFGGGGGASGWEQTTGSPGETTTTPINAPGGSNQDGPDIIMAPGNGDGTGYAGALILRPAAGAFRYEPLGSIIDNSILIDGTNAGGIVYINPPYSFSSGVLAGIGQPVFISSGQGDLGGGGLFLEAGSVNVSGSGGALTLLAGNGMGYAGGAVEIIAGSDPLNIGAGATWFGAAGSGVAGGFLEFESGVGYGVGGGDLTFQASGDFNGARTGNMYFTCAHITGTGGDGNMFFTAAQADGGGGGSISLTAGTDTAAGAGGNLTFAGGASSGGGGGSISFTAGSDNSSGAGGNLTFISGTSNSGAAGNVIIILPAGSPDGDLIINLPGTDPGVSQAIWNNSGVLEVSGNSLPSGTISLASLTALGTQGSITVVKGVITAFANPT